MKKIISLVLVTVLLISSLSCSVMSLVDVTLPFSDVSISAWYYDEVKTAFEADIMKGKTSTSFDPTANMSRAEFVTVLCRLSGDEYEEKGTSLTFSDTKTNAWYADYVAWGVETEMVKGLPGNKFAPDQAVSRQEMAVFIDRFISYINTPLSDNSKIDTFADADKVADYAKEAVETMRKSGIITGDENGCFNPKNNASRAEVATVVTRILPLVKKDNNSDIIEDDETPYPYTVYLPDDYSEDKTYPLLVYITTGNLNGVDIYFENPNSPAYDSIVLVPHIPSGTWDESNTENLTVVVEYVANKYSTDTNRRYVTAVGQGVFAAWKLILSAPEKVAGTILVHGGSITFYQLTNPEGPPEAHNPNDINEGVLSVPTYIVHDKSDDKVIYPNYGKWVYDTLKSEGNENVFLKETTEYGGSIVNKFVTKDDISLLEWLFNQSRETK